MASARVAALGLAADRQLIAERGREIRRARRLSLVEAAVTVPVAEATLCRWERGLRRPSAHHARAYAAFLRQLEGLTA